MFLGALAYQGRTRWTHAAVFIWILYGVLTATLSARIGIIGISFAAAVYLSERYQKLAQGLAFLCVSVWVVVGWPWLPTFLKVEVPIILLVLATPLGLLQSRTTSISRPWQGWSKSHEPVTTATKDCHQAKDHHLHNCQISTNQNLDTRNAISPSATFCHNG
jgi:hypothetical protein